MIVAQADLEKYLLLSLKRCSGCSGAEAVYVTTEIDLFEVNGNWDTAAVDSGKADPAACRQALTALVPPLQRRYLLRRPTQAA